MNIAHRYARIRREIPEDVQIVVAAKSRTSQEIKEVIDAGAIHIGENYVQEAERVHAELGTLARQVTWHMIGHLQKNKINKALPLFDMIQTIDSLALARAIDQRVERSQREVVPLLLEINIADEESKFGVRVGEHGTLHSTVEEIAKQTAALTHVRIEGLMTMGPLHGSPDTLKSHFRTVKHLFEALKSAHIDGVDMKYLSMGMSDSYLLAIEEGSNMVRVGTAIFGSRKE